MAPTNAAHRAGAWKQSNKGHNTGRHRSKGAVEKENRGRVGVQVCGKKARKIMGRLDRRHKQEQLRKAAKETIAAKKKALGYVGAPPVLVAVVSLAASQDEGVLQLVSRLSTCMPDTEVQQPREGLFHMSVPRFKQRFTIVQPDRTSLHAVLDTAKVCDSIVFVLCPHTGIDSWGETLLSSILGQGLPSDPIFLVGSMDEIPPKKHNEVKKLLAKALERKITVEKVYSVMEDIDAINLVRTLGNQKRRDVSFKSRRGHIYSEKVEFVEAADGTGTLAVTGFVRGAALSANRLVHIPGWGDFQVDRIESTPESLKLRGGRGDQEMDNVQVLDRADEGRQDLDCENVPDCMDGEQTWPTEEELQAADIAAEPVSRKVAKVPKGMSDYQASWIVEEGDDKDDNGSEDDDDDDDDDDDEDMNCPDEMLGEESEDDGEEHEDIDFDTQTDTMTEAGDCDYDAKHVNFAAEVNEMEALKSARTDSQFPDEVDTPMDVAARIRFQKYRGLKSFKSSVWDPRENLPSDYARIFQFQNFDRTRKRVMGEKVGGAEVGTYVTIYIVGVGSHLYRGQPTTSLVVSSILPHEHRMSVLNMVVRRSPISLDTPIKSKQRLVFQCGWRRFAACPVFSQHTNGNKHKYERWFRDGVIVMTTFAPISFPPSPILVFQELQDGRLSLLATGSLLSADPNRVVVKRTVLSGHPFQINKRVVTVRFLFFNREDVEWFKPVELRTKTGRRGHIKDGLGTHGHMKCIFDGQISQQDAVLMNLYKRVFPKWTYDPFVADGKSIRHVTNLSTHGGSGIDMEME